MHFIQRNYEYACERNKSVARPDTIKAKAILSLCRYAENDRYTTIVFFLYFFFQNVANKLGFFYFFCWAGRKSSNQKCGIVTVHCIICGSILRCEFKQEKKQMKWLSISIEKGPAFFPRQWDNNMSCVPFACHFHFWFKNK